MTAETDLEVGSSSLLRDAVLHIPDRIAVWPADNFAYFAGIQFLKLPVFHNEVFRQICDHAGVGDRVTIDERAYLDHTGLARIGVAWAGHRQQLGVDGIILDRPMGEPYEAFDVFLSHAHSEAEAVESIAVKLEDKYGLRVWLDRWILIPGERWQQEMARGLDQAKTCAVFVGSNTPSGWFREEIERALSRQTKKKTFRVIPVILPNGDRGLIDDFLALRTWVEFKEGLEDPDAFHLLVSGIRGVPPGRRSGSPSTEEQGTKAVDSSSGPSSTGSLRQLTNAQLRERSIRFTDQLREFEAEFKFTNDRASNQDWAIMCQIPIEDKKAKEAKFHAMHANDRERHSQHVAQLQVRYLRDAQAFQEELNRRLGIFAPVNDRRALMLNQSYLGGPSPALGIATYLDELIRKLPD